MAKRDDLGGDAILKDIRDRYTYADSEWQSIREDAKKDVLCLAGKPWDALDPAGKKLRQETKRPYLALDELTQYVNQLQNDVRSSKRGVKVTPTGDGANDATAEFRQNYIREVEYKSRAQQQVYASMFDNTVQRGYGFMRITSRYLRDRYAETETPSSEWFNQEIIYESFDDPDVVTPDPDFRRQSLADMQYCFVREPYPHDEFLRRWKGAEIRDFAGAWRTKGVSPWVNSRQVWVGEYWSIETKPRKLVLLQPRGKGEPQAFWRDEIPGEQWAKVKDAVVRERMVDNPYVCQKITNGLEILEKIDWPGRYIPIVGCLGKVLWVDEGGGPKRHLMSLVRLARDPYMLYCYIRTCEAEAIGGVPRSTTVGYEGQFSGHEAEWQKANREPVAFLQVKPTSDAARGQLLPLPQRQSWDPPLQNLEIAAESARRAIQSAIGSGFLPTEAQKRNEKSGVALEKIETSAQRGSFHFVDHFEDSMNHIGEVTGDLIPHIIDTARDVYVRQPDDTAIHVRVNDPSVDQPLMTNEGQHDYTISTGPSLDSERDAQQKFIEHVISGPLLKVIGELSGPKIAQFLVAKAVKMQQLGALGDEIVEMLTPQEFKQQGAQMPPEAIAQVQQAQQMVQQAMAKIQELQQQIDADTVKAQANYAIAELKGEIEKAKILLKGKVDLTLQNDQQAHETGMAGADAAVAEQQAERQMTVDLANGGPEEQPPQQQTSGAE